LARTVLITGASRGIGAACAAAFAADGWNVAINYFSGEEKALALSSSLKQNGANALAVRADVSDPAQVRDMAAQVLLHFGRIDALINNAGIAQQKLFCDLTDADWDRMFDVNVKGVFYCSRAVLPHMIHNKQGKIVNISSVWGIAGASCEVHYSASKAAVIGLTKALAKELGPSGIQVNCVAPGVISTDMNAKLDNDAISRIREETPLGVLGSAEDIANAVLFLSSEKADFITGQVLSPNGGFVI